MSYTSFGFFLLAAVSAAGYYILPSRRRWIWLLAASCIYYLAAGPVLMVYLVFAAFTAWAGSFKAAKGSRCAAAIVLLLDFGMLGLLKYSNFAISSLNGLFGFSFPARHILLPLGISFYTFQSAGYVIDVYRKWYEPEKNFARFFLFVSFYPQLMQGPIGRYASLAPQLYAGAAFDQENIRRGIWRISYGLFKKMIVADNAAIYVNSIFDSYTRLPGLGWQGVLMYSIQLYADFSGGIDIALGIARLFGIRLDENFRQPFFAVSLTDFWHRWHITLGTWMKDYLFYPISLSGWMKKLQKRCRKIFGKNTGRALTMGLANIIVFLVVGIWHGPAWHFIFYGLYNGILIALGGLFAGPFRSWKKTLGIRDESRLFHLFCIVRTFVIVNISWFFDRSETMGQALHMLRSSLTGPVFSISAADPANPDKCVLYLACALLGSLVILIISILKERGKDIGAAAAHLPFPARVTALTAIWLLCAVLGSRQEGGFIYANF